MNCKICNKKYESPMGLARHFTQKHKISSKEELIKRYNGEYYG